MVHKIGPIDQHAASRRNQRPCDCGMCRRSQEHAELTTALTTGLLKGRSLVLIDHQNLCGGPTASAEVVSALWDALTQTLAVKPADDLVIALSGYAAASYMPLLPLARVRLLLGDGPHGAARALCDFVDVAHVAARYDNVVIASGNHTLSSLASDLRSHGVRVYNLTSSLSSASQELTSACSLRVRLKVRFDTDPHPLAHAA